MNRDFSLFLFVCVLLVIGPTQGIAQTQAPADLSPFTVVPRGFGGSVMNDVIYYFDRIVAKYNPRAIVLYEGDNDLAWGLSPETILNQLDILVDMIKLELPDTRLYILSVKPSIARANLWALAQEVNAGFALRAESDENIFHIDVDTYLLDESGGFRSDLYLTDFLHLNAAGYDSDRLAVTLAEDQSVESALYWTEKLYIRGESTKYNLNTEYSSARNPVSENGGKFIFDQIDYSIAE